MLLLHFSASNTYLFGNARTLNFSSIAKNRDFSAEADAAYFGSYNGVPVHEKMIKDDIRINLT